MDHSRRQEKEQSMSAPDKIINLMQFARKAGKLVCGTEATMRGVSHHQIRLVIVAADAAERTIKRMEQFLELSEQPPQLIRLGSTEAISAALGLPKTAVFGVAEKNFALKMKEYWAADK